jgi:tetratricopeptide (TPR) repeat protein
MNDLDLATKGKLLTSLLRVGRQVKPPSEAGVTDAAPSVEASSENAAAESANANAEAAPVPSEVQGVAGDALAAEALAAPETAAPSEPLPAEAPIAAVAPSPIADSQASSTPEGQWMQTMLMLGRIWRVLKDDEKASRAFESSGLPVPSSEPELSAAAAAPTRDNRERSPGKRGRDSVRPPRVEKSERLSPGDWRFKARAIEEKGRTREAGKMHEQHESWAEASRLYEVGGDFKSALKCAFRAKDDARVEKLKAHVNPEEVPQLLEQAQAWERLMEHHIAQGNYEAVAKLYERAKQFDQAALAYERAGKLSLARKSYERVRDLPAVNRVRDLEVKQLVQRGDRLGAATLLMTASMKDAALEVLKELPSPKAFRFMQKLKLDTEALALAKVEIEKAVADSAHATRARWLEMVGEVATAIEAWLLAERKDKALTLLEQMGNWAKAAELAEQLGHLDKAESLFHRANDRENAERVAQLPRPQVETAPPVTLTPADDEGAEFKPVAES